MSFSFLHTPNPTPAAHPCSPPLRPVPSVDLDRLLRGARAQDGEVGSAEARVDDVVGKRVHHGGELAGQRGDGCRQHGHPGRVPHHRPQAEPGEGPPAYQHQHQEAQAQLGTRKFREGW